MSDRLFDYLHNDDVVLDIGCGYGRLAGLFKKQGCVVYGIDINISAIEETQRNLNLSGIKFSVQNAEHTNFQGSFFNVVVSQAVLACMNKQKRKKTVQEIYRILKSGGILHIAEFGRNDDIDRYVQDEKNTKEYGTVIVKNLDGSERFRTHNFLKSELEELLTQQDFKILSYENLDFTTVHGNFHPGHIFICQK